ncbi:hypothetical protein L1987_72505 [Smallanthus sonchifolius]|uniref:Uncharacterized protein n=1 Tax=Smallanthus sonchifolius TaxID=185202 RepID=A0ACB9AUK1_9ASTR|nr:hypothetical protein L1987_72505 [Smallanthus sonchifolius]
MIKGVWLGHKNLLYTIKFSLQFNFKLIEWARLGHRRPRYSKSGPYSARLKSKSNEFEMKSGHHHSIHNCRKQLKYNKEIWQVLEI